MRHSRLIPHVMLSRDGFRLLLCCFWERPCLVLPSVRPLNPDLGHENSARQIPERGSEAKAGVTALAATLAVAGASWRRQGVFGSPLKSLAGPLGGKHSETAGGAPISHHFRKIGLGHKKGYYSVSLELLF